MNGGSTKDVLGTHARGRGKPQNGFRRWVRGLHQPIAAEDQNSTGEIREYGLTEIFGRAGTLLLGLRLHLQLMFLLLQLLNDCVVEMEGQSIDRRRRAIGKIGFLSDVLPQAPNYIKTQHKRCDRAAENQGCTKQYG